MNIHEENNERLADIGSMELFQNAKIIRLQSYDDKYLIAGEDEETVVQDRDGSTENSLWRVELIAVGKREVIRLRSCYGKYLTATNTPFIPKVTARMVLQTCKEGKRTEWEPIRDGFQVRLRTFSGNYLRPNGGLPPWRNSITHDIPHWNKTMDKLLWDVHVVETRLPVVV